jgi:hypothetical protein
MPALNLFHLPYQVNLETLHQAPSKRTPHRVLKVKIIRWDLLAASLELQPVHPILQ